MMNENGKKTMDAKVVVDSLVDSLIKSRERAGHDYNSARTYTLGYIQSAFLQAIQDQPKKKQKETLEFLTSIVFKLAKE